MIFVTTHYKHVLSITPAMTDRVNSYRVWLGQIDGCWAFVSDTLAELRAWMLARMVADVFKPLDTKERWELVERIDRLFAKVKGL